MDQGNAGSGLGASPRTMPVRSKEPDAKCDRSRRRFLPPPLPWGGCPSKGRGSRRPGRARPRLRRRGTDRSACCSRSPGRTTPSAARSRPTGSCGIAATSRCPGLGAACGGPSRRAAVQARLRFRTAPRQRGCLDRAARSRREPPGPGDRGPGKAAGGLCLRKPSAPSGTPLAVRAPPRSSASTTEHASASSVAGEPLPSAIAGAHGV